MANAPWIVSDGLWKRVEPLPRKVERRSRFHAASVCPTADEAREPLEGSLAVAQRLGYREAAAYALSGLASLAVAENELPRAARLLAATDSLLVEIGTTLLPFISDLDVMTRAAVIGTLGEDAFARMPAEARGAALDELLAGGAVRAATATSVS
jgi:hypothetical protein